MKEKVEISFLDFKVTEIYVLVKWQYFRAFKFPGSTKDTAGTCDVSLGDCNCWISF